MNKDFFEILERIEKNPVATQRQIAKEGNFALVNQLLFTRTKKKRFNKNFKFF